ncbi:uncharacterized protein L3040_000423 [Drepanopeziza brunnea f. sp. 'multigermtubi']|uniref:uncharacterized protein n=1 Tax=Drepanopeziza brunnea f. sp. 'multigermtubi' TaxID=698441 RepID=UPI0023976F2D|nr:hypothetical protein L3040_000423 [Drepanopeziza brunnea f. sp. 'multigermtubi']
MSGEADLQTRQCCARGGYCDMPFPLPQKESDSSTDVGTVKSREKVVDIHCKSPVVPGSTHCAHMPCKFSQTDLRASDGSVPRPS